MENIKQQEAANYIIQIIRDELKNINYKSIKVIDSYNKLKSCIAFQIYYCKELNKFYLYYELNDITKDKYDRDGLYLRINGRIYNNFKNFMNSKISILGAPYKVKTESMTPNADHCGEHLRENTYTYWRCIDGTYKFISDRDALITDHEFWVDLENAYKNIQKEEEFLDIMIDINRKYDFINKNSVDVKLAFEEYSIKYKEFFNRFLNPIPDEDITYVYLQIEM